jgi:trans-2-enoyl-CoA reductase
LSNTTFNQSHKTKLNETLQSSTTVNKTKLQLNKEKRNCTVKVKKNKILIIGDSHSRGYAANISNYCGKVVDVMGAVMPGARIQDIIKANIN